MKDSVERKIECGIEHGIEHEIEYGKAIAETSRHWWANGGGEIGVGAGVGWALE